MFKWHHEFRHFMFIHLTLKLIQVKLHPLKISYELIFIVNLLSITHQLNKINKIMNDNNYTLLRKINQCMLR